MQILVSGFMPQNSGKTTLAKALAYTLRTAGYDIGVFKPVSGHNWYSQYDASIKNFMDRKLYCEDIMKLASAAGIREEYEILNPIDILTAPVNLRYFLIHRYISRYFYYMENTFMQAVITRISYKHTNSIENIYLINQKLIGRSIVEIDDIFLKSVTSNASRKIFFENPEKLTQIISIYGEKSIESCYKYMLSKYPYLLIESFNDAAIPSTRLKNIDIVLAVAPRYVVIYDGSKYLKACKTVSSIRGLVWENRVMHISSLIKPFKIFKTNPLRKEDLDNLNRLSTSFSDIIDFIEERIEE